MSNFGLFQWQKQALMKKDIMGNFYTALREQVKFSIFILLFNHFDGVKNRFHQMQGSILVTSLISFQVYSMSFSLVTFDPIAKRKKKIPLISPDKR